MAKQKIVKKKGPKGKKARAKAKLDRQWGETAIIDDDKPQRRGKSRLKAQRSKGTTDFIHKRDNDFAVDAKEEETRQTFESKISQESSSRARLVPRRRKRQDSTDDSHSESDFEEEEEEEEQGDETIAVRDFLSSIQRSRVKSGSKKRIEGARNMEDDPDIEMDDNSFTSGDNDGYVDASSDSDIVVSDSDESMDKDDVDTTLDGKSTENSNLDLFYQHFGRAPMNKKEMEEVFTTPFKIRIDSQTELQVCTKNHASGNFPVNSATTLAQLKRLAKSSFEGNRKVLKIRWEKSRKTLLTEKQSIYYPFLTRYMDMLQVASSRRERKELQSINLLHILNHVLTARGRVQRHNRSLKEATKESDADVDEGKNDARSEVEINEERIRDQGFTRPTVLVLLPTRDICRQYVLEMIKISGADKKNPHLDRFNAEFGKDLGESDDENENESEAQIDPKKELRRKEVLNKKGKHWNEFFGDDVNQDDDFKLGIAVIPKAAKAGKKESVSSNLQIKLYTDFYKSDIIFASPLGLKMLLAPDEDGKEGDSDFLSSIEICLIPNADILMMQNWDHVNDVLGMLNNMPAKNNDTDFSRVRLYALEGQSAHWRQVIISTDLLDPFILSSFKRYSKSIAGSMKSRRKTQPQEAALANVFVSMKQVFQRTPVSSFAQQTDGRVQYFVKNILPELQRRKQKHTMIYIPSYFDFVALRNLFLKRDVEFVSVHEYSRHTEVSRGRARFLQGRKPIMLYTGRSNFFYRHAIRGIRHLIFLGLPEHSQFYADQVNLINTSTEVDDAGNSSMSSCLALFTKFEGHALERIVGTGNSTRMLKSDKSTFMFHS